MNTTELYIRLRLGLAIVVGFALGRYLASVMGHHASEFFVAGFAAGVVLTQGLFHIHQRLKQHA